MTNAAGLLWPGCVLLALVSGACGNDRARNRDVGPTTEDQARSALEELRSTFAARSKRASACRTRIEAAIAKLPEVGSTKPARPGESLKGVPRWEGVYPTSPFVGTKVACKLELPPYAWNRDFSYPPAEITAEQQLAWAKSERAKLGAEPDLAPPAKLAVLRTVCSAKAKTTYRYPELGSEYEGGVGLNAYACTQELVWMEVETGRVLASALARGRADPEKAPNDLKYSELESRNHDTELNATVRAQEVLEAIAGKWEAG
jgi:hypothetical protein